MSNIEYGSIEYFELLSFRDKLKNNHLKLDLLNLDRLRSEVWQKVEVINETEKQRRQQNSIQQAHDKAQYE